MKSPYLSSFFLFNIFRFHTHAPHSSSVAYGFALDHGRSWFPRGRSRASWLASANVAHRSMSGGTWYQHCALCHVSLY